MKSRTKRPPSMAAQIRELQAMPIDDLVRRYRELHGTEPSNRQHGWLWKRCAWRLQEIEYGEASGSAKDRLDQMLSGVKLPSKSKRSTTPPPKRRRRRRKNDPMPGTRIVRPWNGHELILHVRDDGYEVDGVLYRSLTAAANAVTGSQWNGRLFWGLAKRKRRS